MEKKKRRHKVVVKQYCPICKEEMSGEARHVTVEAFYSVDEVAPRFKAINSLYKIVKPDSVYLGSVLEFPKGSTDVFDYSRSIGPNCTEIVTKKQVVPPSHFLQLSGYSHDCCKNCRADFLKLCRKWSEGKFHKKRKDEI